MKRLLDYFLPKVHVHRCSGCKRLYFTRFRSLHTLDTHRVTGAHELGDLIVERTDYCGEIFYKGKLV